MNAVEIQKQKSLAMSKLRSQQRDVIGEKVDKNAIDEFEHSDEAIEILKIEK